MDFKKERLAFEADQSSKNMIFFSLSPTGGLWNSDVLWAFNVALGSMITHNSMILNISLRKKGKLAIKGENSTNHLKTLAMSQQQRRDMIKQVKQESLNAPETFQ